MFLFNKPSRYELEKEIEGLDKALLMLEERYQKKTVTIETFSSKCEELGKRKEKCLKKLEKLDNEENAS